MPNCPEHDVALMTVPHPLGRGQAYCCTVVGCTHIEAAPDRRINLLKLPGMGRGKQSRVFRWTEKETEHAVDQFATVMRWDWANTSVKYKYQMVSCPGCKYSWEMRPEGGYGATPGIPDRIYYPSWLRIPYVGILMDLKGSHTPFTSNKNPKFADAQKRLSEQRRIAFCRSSEDVENVMKYLERVLR